MPQETFVYIHGVWRTKNSAALLHPELVHELIHFFKNNKPGQGFFIDHVNAAEDHVHVLFRIYANQTIAEVFRIMKGGSSYHLNRCGKANRKIQWSDKYFAASVDYRKVENVRKYIRRQQKRHQRSRFDIEYDLFICEYLDNLEKEKSVLQRSDIG